jgi:hypothetical protein
VIDSGTITIIKITKEEEKKERKKKKKRAVPTSNAREIERKM